MNITFANGVEVPAWKIRKGCVVLWEGHLRHINGFLTNTHIYIDGTAYAQPSIELTWLEPT